MGGVSPLISGPDWWWIRCEACPSDTYISLDDHPGVGQTHVALCAEQLQPLFQVPLSVVINLEQKETGKREGTPLKGWFRLSRVRWDELSAFYLYRRIPDNRARTACTCVRKYISWLLLQMVTWQHFSWTWQFRFLLNWTAPTFGYTGGTCHRSISKLVKSTSRSFGFSLAAQFQQRKAK